MLKGGSRTLCLSTIACKNKALGKKREKQRINFVTYKGRQFNFLICVKYANVKLTQFLFVTWQKALRFQGFSGKTPLCRSQFSSIGIRQLLIESFTAE